jgi:hypothetical protein
MSSCLSSQAELKHFHFQTKFLWPFVAIVTNNPPPPPEVREFVVRVVINVVQGRAQNIRSGWKSILAVFSVVATDEDTSLVGLAFKAVNSLLQVCTGGAVCPLVWASVCMSTRAYVCVCMCLCVYVCVGI